MTYPGEYDTAPENANTRSADTRSPNTRINVRRLALAMFLALGILGLLNSAALERYAGDFSGSVAAEEALIMAGKWNALMQEAGLDAPREFIREQVAAFRSWRFEGE